MRFLSGGQCFGFPKAGFKSEIPDREALFFLISVTAAGAEGFHLLELSVGGKGTGSAGIEGGNEDEGEDRGSQTKVLLSVRGDGRVSMDGGGGLIVKNGDLEVSQGDAIFKVHRRG